jgi:hypothetical protein
MVIRICKSKGPYGLAVARIYLGCSCCTGRSGSETENIEIEVYSVLIVKGIKNTWKGNAFPVCCCPDGKGRNQIGEICVAHNVRWA